MERDTDSKGKAETSRNDLYEYDPLSPGQFRYLLLQPGAGSDPLRCSLRTSTTADAKYEALSYVWGSDVKDREILCDGRVLAITSNLHEALQRLRNPRDVRSLWADSICIHQNNLKEKAHQVKNMGRVFSGAQRVVIYVGPDYDGHGPAVKTLLKEFRIMIDRELGKVDRSEWDSMPWPPHDEPILTDPRWPSLIALVQERWFSRGWVLQEAALAHQGSVVWGSADFPWDDLMCAKIWIDNRASHTDSLRTSLALSSVLMPHADAYADRHIDYLRAFLEGSQFRMSGLLDLLHSGRLLEFTDDRDRVYAFLGLGLLPGEDIGIVPDYHLLLSDVWKDFATEYIRQTNSLRLLSYVVHSAQSLRSSVPTWVPQWNSVVLGNLTLSLNRDAYRGGLTSRNGKIHTPEVMESGVLKVRGVFIDKVCFVSDIFSGSTTTPKSLLELCKVVETLVSARIYPLGHTWAFLDTLVRCSYEGVLATWELRQTHFVDDFESHTTATHCFQWSGDNERRGGLDSLVSSIAEFTHGLRFVLTERGYMGLGPAVCQKSDECAILFGNRHQCFLRNSEGDHTPSYQFLGPGFILGANMASAGLGAEDSKDWVDWDVEEQDIHLC